MLNSISILNTERHTLDSKTTGKTYQISIALPYNYFDDIGKGGPFSTRLPAWPVVYLTDANWHFNMVTDFVRESAWCGRSFDAIVVGIGYPESESAQESWRINAQLRSDDLTPVRIPENETAAQESIHRSVKTGGGEKFLAFLKGELIPWVEQTYRADAQRRILVGHSYGGLFALYTMFQDPTLFRSYIAASPYLVDPERSIFTLESEYPKNHTDLATQLYLAAGELENLADDTTLIEMHRFAALLKSRNYPSLSLTEQVFEDNNHCEVAVPALHAGLKWVLKK